MNFKKLKVKVKKAAVKRKTKLLRGDYKVRDKANKVIGYAVKVGQNVADDVTPNRQSVNQMFPFSQPRQQQKNRSVKRARREEKQRKPNRNRRRSLREPYNPYPLI